MTAITDEEVQFSNGLILDLLGNTVRFPDGRHVKGSQTNPLEFSVGRRWNSRFIVTFPNGTRAANEQECAITARERVTVPAGTFDAFRIQARTFSQSPKGLIELRTVIWRVPGEIRQPVAAEENRFMQGKTIFSSRRELVAFNQQ